MTTHIVPDLTPTQKKVIRKLKAGIPLIYTKTQIVGREAEISYRFVDGTNIRRTTAESMKNLGIITAVDVQRKDHFGYTERTCGFKLSAGY